MIAVPLFARFSALLPSNGFLILAASPLFSPPCSGFTNIYCPYCFYVLSVAISRLCVSGIMLRDRTTGHGAGSIFD